MISIVIPTYERPAQLRRCLEGILEIDPPRGGFEVVVVDDGGSEPVDPAIAPFRDALRIALVRQPHAGPAAARNAGAQRAAGSCLAFLDDDCVPEAGWLRALDERLERAPGDLVGGRTVNALADDLYACATQMLVDFLCDYHGLRNGEPSFFASNNIALTRERFDAIGGFDAGFCGPAGEDRDFCDRWRRSGRRMTWAPEAVVHHAHALTLRSFLRQHFTYGRGACAYRRARALRESGRMAFEPARFYLELLRAPLQRDRGSRAWRLAAALLLAQLANATGFAWESGQHPTLA